MTSFSPKFTVTYVSWYRCIHTICRCFHLPLSNSAPFSISAEIVMGGYKKWAPSSSAFDLSFLFVRSRRSGWTRALFKWPSRRVRPIWSYPSGLENSRTSLKSTEWNEERRWRRLSQTWRQWEITCELIFSPVSVIDATLSPIAAEQMPPAPLIREGN